MLPPKSTLQKIADASYKSSSPIEIDGWKLVKATPTLRFYMKGNEIVVGIRGTVPTDIEDVKADASIPLGLLDTTNRYKNDLLTLQTFQQQYNPTQYTYYGVGHSLGGAILDNFLKSKLIRQGISYNPAVQSGDFNKEIANQRIYNESDPLYKLMGRHTKGAEVRKYNAPVWKKIVAKIPYVGKVLESLDAHKLSNFVGGGYILDYEIEKDKPTIYHIVDRKTRKIVYSTDVKEEAIAVLNEYLKKAKEETKPKTNYVNPTTSAFKPYKKEGKGKETKFMTQLEEVGLTPKQYLMRARKQAKKEGYNPKELMFADDGVHKLQIRNRKFGRVGYNDFLIWSHLEKTGKVPKGTAQSKQNRFVKSHSKIKGDWKDDDYSPNWLSIRILW